MKIKCIDAPLDTVFFGRDAFSLFPYRSPISTYKYLSNIVKQKSFVEIGTFYGDGIFHMIKNNPNIYSYESNKDHYRYSTYRIESPSLYIEHSTFPPHPHTPLPDKYVPADYYFYWVYDSFRESIDTAKNLSQHLRKNIDSQTVTVFFPINIPHSRPYSTIHNWNHFSDSYTFDEKDPITPLPEILDHNSPPIEWWEQHVTAIKWKEKILLHPNPHSQTPPIEKMLFHDDGLQESALFSKQCIGKIKHGLTLLIHVDINQNGMLI